jgi:hypothetical protein
MSGNNDELFEQLIVEETDMIKEYLKGNEGNLAEKYSLTLTSSRIDLIATCYAKNTLDIGNIITKIKSFYDEVKKIELYFFKNHDINIVLEENAIDFIIEQLIDASIELNLIYEKIDADFQHGLKLAREKTGRSRYFITREALLDPEAFVGKQLQDVVNPLAAPDKQ